jgi:hypothetical protein
MHTFTAKPPAKIAPTTVTKHTPNCTGVTKQFVQDFPAKSNIPIQFFKCTCVCSSSLEA